MSAGLQSFLACLALDWTVLPLRIVRALGAVVATAITTAAVVTRDHGAPREAIPAAGITGATAEEGPVPMTHHGPGPPSTTAIGRGPAEGVDPITEAGPDPQGGIPVINPILQIASIPDVP